MVQDINDNPPELVESSRDQEILENSATKGQETRIGRLYAFDRDTEKNGKPFTFVLNDNSLFKLDPQTGWLSTSANFDREKQALFVLHVLIRDSGTPAMTNNVTVRVHVTDRNDNQHTEGRLRLSLNIFDQQTISSTAPVGYVFVNDSDTDDLRYYDVISGDSDTFAIDRLTGSIVVTKRPLPKVYKFRVRVSDRNSSFQPVVCHVKIKVNIIPSIAFSRSFTMRFREITISQFLTSIDTYRNEIAKALKIIPQNVDIFSIQSGLSVNAGRKSPGDTGGIRRRIAAKIEGRRRPMENVVDVQLAAHGSPYYAAERLIWILKREQKHSKYLHNATIGYDACVEEPCELDGCRSEIRLTGRVQTLDNGRGEAFRSIENKVIVRCESCQKAPLRKKSCRDRPCLNSGVCRDIPGGKLLRFIAKRSSSIILAFYSYICLLNMK